MFWVFNKEKRELRALMTLAERTISRMENLLNEPMNLVKKRQIEAYLQGRRDKLSDYTRFYNGRGCDNEFDVILNPVRNGRAGTARDAMSNELQYFMGSVGELCQYLTKIKPIPSEEREAHNENLWEEFTLTLADEIIMSTRKSENGPLEASIKAVGTLAQVIHIITADEQREDTLKHTMNMLRTYLNFLDDLHGTKGQT